MHWYFHKICLFKDKDQHTGKYHSCCKTFSKPWWCSHLWKGQAKVPGTCLCLELSLDI